MSKETAPMDANWEEQQISTNGITLHVVAAGPPDGPLVILLHGWPEFWVEWRAQIAFLAAAGYRVLAPDQRGYNLSDKPKGLRAYHLDALAQDVIGLIDVAGRDKATVVGHDWGANVAWWLGMKHPQRVDRLVPINAPHPLIAQRTFQRSRAQMRKSWYILVFQLPWLPETLMRLGDWWVVVRNLRITSRPGTYTAADFQEYRQAWARPGAMTSMLNWYRALVQGGTKIPDPPRVSVPTMLIWGIHDTFLGQEMARPSVALCDQGRLELLDASHWVPREEPDRVNALLADFLRG